jgi:hypothetical protein
LNAIRFVFAALAHMQLDSSARVALDPTAEMNVQRFPPPWSVVRREASLFC